MTDAGAPPDPVPPVTDGPVPPTPPAGPAITLDNPRRELVVGGAIIVLFFVIFLGWAALAPLDAGAYAQGQIAISGNRQAVQHREGGVVSALLVAEGDTVRSGQVLLQLSSGELKAIERGVSSQVFALIAQRARLVAERDRLGSIPSPAEFANLPVEDQRLARESLRIQQQQFGARRTGRTTETGVLGQRVAQLNEQIAGYEGQIVANTEQQRLIQEELAGMRSLAEQGFAPLTRVRALERTAAQLAGELGSLRAQIAQSREAVGEARLQMSGVSTRMNEDVADQLRQIDVQLNELKPRMAELRAQIERNEVRAPVSWTVKLSAEMRVTRPRMIGGLRSRRPGKRTSVVWPIRRLSTSLGAIWAMMTWEASRGTISIRVWPAWMTPPWVKMVRPTTSPETGART